MPGRSGHVLACTEAGEGAQHPTFPYRGEDADAVAGTASKRGRPKAAVRSEAVDEVVVIIANF